jgi:hypothetical protein
LTGRQVPRIVFAIIARLTMRVYRLTQASRSAGPFVPLMGRTLGLVVLFLLAYADTSPAQVIPGRLNMLQQYRQVAPAPVPQVERLRQDIVRAVDPATGTVDVRKLSRPFLTEIQGPTNVPWRVVEPGKPFLGDVQGPTNVPIRVGPKAQQLPAGNIGSNVPIQVNESAQQSTRRKRPRSNVPIVPR